MVSYSRPACAAFCEGVPKILICFADVFRRLRAMFAFLLFFREGLPRTKEVISPGFAIFVSTVE